MSLILESSIEDMLVKTHHVVLSENVYENVTRYMDVKIKTISINGYLEGITVSLDKVLDNNTMVCMDHDRLVIGLIKVGSAGFVLPFNASDAFVKSYSPDSLDKGILLTH